MRSILILAIFVFIFASCHNDVPNLPSSEVVKGYKYCKYKEEIGGCKSTYEISVTDCGIVGGKFFCDSNCTGPVLLDPNEPCPEKE